MLLDNGANTDARRNDGRTAYALAVQSGQTETAAVLAQRGASTEISAFDRFMGACQTAQPEELERLLANTPEMIRSPEIERLVPDLAISHRTAAVRALLAAGMPVDARGELGGTALHWACWKGYADLVKVLLDYGASLTLEDHQFHGIPAGWFAHGLQNCAEGGGDYAQVAKLLLGAGATIPQRDVPTGHADVDAVLREYGLIK
jgi:ankyrin repeat protein